LEQAVFLKMDYYKAELQGSYHLPMKKVP
jgi:hypothetical protein